MTLPTTSLKPHRVSLLGAGYILQAQAQALGVIGNMTLNAVWGLSQERAMRAAAECGILNPYTTVAQLLVSDCGVVRGLPQPFLHIDLSKKALKYLIRHPNRRVPRFCDWNCRAYRARYDNSKTRQVLGRRLAVTREAMVRDSIVAAVRHSPADVRDEPVSTKSQRAYPSGCATPRLTPANS